MTKTFAFLGCTLIGLGACVPIEQSAGVPSIQFISEVPESVLAIAAEGQDLKALKIDPVDGCYTFQHVGPVETTFLPLRAKNGRPICTRAAS